MKIVTWMFILLLLVAQTVVAGGDKNQGEKGKGNVHQEQVSK